MKVGIVRGPFLNKWEMQTYEFLPKYGVDIVGIAPKKHFYDISSIKFPIIETHQLGYYNRIPFLKLFIQQQFGIDYYLLNFKKIVKEIDLLHTAETFHIFSHQAIKTNKPTIITVWENIPFNWYKKPYMRIIKSTINRANHFIAITERAKNALELEGIDSSRISVIPVGVDINRFRPEDKDPFLLNKLKIPESSKVILFVGRLVWEKGIFNLIYAFKSILKRHKNLILLIVGNGPEKSRINNLVLKLGIEKQVRFVRKVDYNQIQGIFNLADLLCVPSIPTVHWKEQFGMVFLEAMSCGKPVISTFSGSIPEVVDHNQTGVLVPPMDNIGLEKALEKILEDNSTKFQQNARKLVEKKFNSYKIAKDIANLYKKVINRF
ncbi:MAG: glycosyltransferase [Candidatus Lokiarchaeota archaeon]|nr:glycosyltransferase [Candidatus Lokiarchaeota archaeon]